MTALSTTVLSNPNNSNAARLQALVTRKSDTDSLFEITDPEWIKWYTNHFERTWEHQNKQAEITTIYGVHRDKRAALVEQMGKRNQAGVTAYTIKDHASVKNKIYYHGTQRACKIGEKTKTLCTKDECHLCHILRESFRLEHANPRGMFGPGIYSTPNSSKADSYAKNHRIHSHQHAIIVCTVVKGERERLFQADSTRTAPTPGFDSVEGVVRNLGGALNYSETVVYREDAIIPRAVIIYTRKGWAPGC
ncbi:hypothetical protein SEUCBS139899_001330 [Sporothrix eucalyptigena]|uniref:PARP catalytic domain-containing protein n=1 Tax=Sporothrix eucalyptigena TaxID=1812306 RepID=A0ABP0CKK5_9PEZI